MSIPLKLTVDTGGNTYVYDDSRLALGDTDIVRRVKGLDVELDSIELLVGPKSDGAAELVGVSDPFALGEETHRAKLERTDTGDTILNGALTTRDAEYEAKRKTWSVVLFNQAAQRFWDELKARFFGDLDQTDINNRNFLVWRRYDADDSFENPGEAEFRKSTAFGYQFMDVLDEIFGQMGWSRDLPPRLFADADGTFDSSKAPTDVYVVIPRWRLSTCVRELCRYAGFRIYPSYQGFSSQDIHVTLAPTTYAQSSPPSIDDGLDQGGSRMRFRKPEYEALQVHNDVAEASPNLLDYSIIQEASDGDSYDTENDFLTFATPPAWALHGTAHWRADPPFRPGGVNPVADPRSFREEVEETRLYIPPVDITSTGIQGKQGRALLPGSAYSEFVSYDTDEPIDEPKEDERAYLLYEGEFDADNKYWVLWGDVDESAYPLGVDAEHWVGTPFRQQRQRRERIQELRGSYRTDAAFQVGTRDGVSAEGKEWVVDEERHSFVTDLRDLRLRRAWTDTDRVYPTVGDVFTWAVMQLDGDIVTIDRTNGKEDWLIAHWQRTSTEWCREYKYEVEYTDPDGNTVTTEVYATAFSVQFAAAGDGGQSYSSRDVKVRPMAPEKTGSTATATVPKD